MASHWLEKPRKKKELYIKTVGLGYVVTIKKFITRQICIRSGEWFIRHVKYMYHIVYDTKNVSFGLYMIIVGAFFGRGIC